MKISKTSLKKRILQISREHHLAHVGSCLSVLGILIEIYSQKDSGDIVIMDNAHAHLAHLVVKEAFGLLSETPEYLLAKYGIHCDKHAGCDASGGSLGHPGIAIGYALANRQRKVYVIVSDGSMQEGSSWEFLRIKDALKLKNIKIYTNFNKYTAVAEIDRDVLVKRMRSFCKDIEVRYTENGTGFDGLQGHYKTL